MSIAKMFGPYKQIEDAMKPDLVTFAEWATRTKRSMPSW